ncbi:MAG: DUF3105 domain-containing protein, partial [Actinomycetota bacterium]
MSKKLKEKQQRRLADEARRAQQKKQQRSANLVTIGIAVAVALVVGILVFQGRNDDGSSGNVGVAAGEAGCNDVETSEAGGNREHVDAGTPVEYDTNPPTTGAHWPPDQVATAGFYEEQIEPERLVHNMEHGQVIIWYDPNASDEVKDQIEALVQQEPAVNIATPWPDVPDGKTLAMTAWSGAGDADQGVIQACERPSQA